MFYGHGLESHLQRLRATLFHSEGERDSDLEGIRFSPRDALKFLQGLSEDKFKNAILEFKECEALEECVQPCPPPKNIAPAFELAFPRVASSLLKTTLLPGGFAITKRERPSAKLSSR